MAYLYFMTNKPNGTLYVGVTSDLVLRVEQHRAHMVKGFTDRYNLERLVFFERHSDVQTAVQRQNNIKHWKRAWKVALIEKDNPRWDDLWWHIASWR